MLERSSDCVSSHSRRFGNRFVTIFSAIWPNGNCKIKWSWKEMGIYLGISRHIVRWESGSNQSWWMSAPVHIISLSYVLRVRPRPLHCSALKIPVPGPNDSISKLCIQNRTCVSLKVLRFYPSISRCFIGPWRGTEKKRVSVVRVRNKGGNVVWTTRISDKHRIKYQKHYIAGKYQIEIVN